MNKKSVLPLLLLFVLGACMTKQEPAITGNPAAEGFDVEHSDPAAVELADSVMAAMGGRNAWEKTRFISWNFFGRRNLVWDKHEGRVRIEAPADSIIYLVNINSGEGRVQVKGQEIQPSDSLKTMLEQAKSIWINDSYWLVMPFKLKDTGVTLTYLGEDTIANGAKCNVVQITFKNVGDTPENKYHIFIDLKDNLVKQWSYFNQASQDSANFTRPWDNYRKYGDILLSADRSDNGGPRDVAVDETLSDKVFEEF
ncbi:MAG TPA: hypothetical protein VD816_13070 [Ohtaekwangia sp.]|nr:hypothetical protein [Ohtaekwangia sp.]